MSPQLAKTLDQSRTFLLALNPKQKVVLGGSALVTLGLFAFLAHFVGSGDLKTLYSGLPPAEAQEVARRLGAKDVPYEISKDGTAVSVPAGRIDEVRMQLASEGLPRSGRQGFEMFDKPNWMGSDFAEKVNYQRALEGELERTIQTLDEVEGVRVHLVMPHDSLFTEQVRSAKASVLLKLRAGRISDDKIDAITNLVSSAVDNLQPQDVTIVDADGQVPLLSGGSRRGGTKDAHALESSLNDRLIATLTPAVGAGKVKAAVSVDYEFGDSETTQEIYDPNAVAVVNSQTSVERQAGDDSQEQGVAGSPSNVPGASAQAAAAPAAAPADSAEEIQKTENKTYAVSKTLRHQTEPSGTIRKISAAVLIDDAVESSVVNGQKVETRRKRTPDELKQLLDIATMAIGIDPTRGDRISVQNLSFVAMPSEMDLHPTWGKRVERVVLDWSGVLRYLGLFALLAVFYFTFLQPVRNRVTASLAEFRAQMKAAPETAALPAKGESKGRALGSAIEEPLTDLSPELNDTASEVKRAVALKRHLVDKIKTQPAAASRLVQNWVRESEA